MTYDSRSGTENASLSHTQSDSLIYGCSLKPLPVVVYIHGGGWIQGDRHGMDAAAKLFTQHGYMFCSIDYRFTNVAKYPAQIEDCKCAIRYLRANSTLYHIDPTHIGVWGGSAGGHLVALLGTTAGVSRLEGEEGWPEQSSAVQAVADWFGPSDLRPSAFSDYRHSAAIGVVKALLGGSPADVPDAARDASPAAFVAKGDPPLLIEHGDADTLVPLIQSQRIYDALKAAGNDATLTILPGAGHATGEFNTPGNIAQLVAFFDRTLKPAK